MIKAVLKSLSRF